MAHKDVDTTIRVGGSWAAVTFAMVLGAALPIILLWLGKGRWFSQDEWYFFDGRSLSLTGLMSPYFGHWVLLPIVVWRLMYALVGLHSYVPYQLLVVALHLVGCLLLRIIMRRSGVKPWTATIVASVLVLFGAGSTNIISAFQITFMGSFVFGLIYILLVDRRDERYTRWDVCGALCGITAIMCSNVGVGIVAIAIGTILLRRGWRLAVLHLVPLGGIYALWFAFAPEMSPLAPEVGLHGSAADRTGRVIGWVATGLRAGLKGLAHSWGGLTVPIAIAIGFVVLLGCVLGWSKRRQIPAPVCLAGGAIVFVALCAVGRGSFAPAFAAAPRYVYLVAAMILPSLALGMDWLIGRHRLLAIPLAVLVLQGIPANIAAFHSEPADADFALIRQQALSIAYSPYASNADPSLSPIPSPFLPGPSVGWLVAARRQGKLPVAGPVSSEVQNWVAALLQIRQLNGSSDSAKNCEVGTRRVLGVILAPRNGEVVYVRVAGAPKNAKVIASLLRKNNFPLPGGARSFATADGNQFRFAGEGLRVRFTSSNGMVRVCR